MQLSLFGPPPALSLVRPSPEVEQLATRMPPKLRMGTSSWGFKGWKGILWDQEVSEATLAKEGLAAYARHPLLKTVGLDRSHYRPPSLQDYEWLATQVPDDFRFLVKAHEECSLARFPNHPRYGAKSGLLNERYLDPSYATEAVIKPAVEGLKGKLGVILFQFAPQSIGEMGGSRFPDVLHGFLRRLPVGPRYSVELRNSQLLHAASAEAMLDLGITPCLSGWSGLPPIAEQALRLRADRAPIQVIRWMLPIGRGYDETKAAFEPFDRLVEPDPDTRAQIVALIKKAEETYVIVNNKAEGSSPLSIIEIARMLGA